MRLYTVSKSPTTTKKLIFGKKLDKKCNPMERSQKPTINNLRTHKRYITKSVLCKLNTALVFRAIFIGLRGLLEIGQKYFGQKVLPSSCQAPRADGVLAYSTAVRRAAACGSGRGIGGGGHPTYKVYIAAANITRGRDQGGVERRKRQLPQPHGGPEKD